MMLISAYRSYYFKRIMPLEKKVAATSLSPHTFACLNLLRWVSLAIEGADEVEMAYHEVSLNSHSFDPDEEAGDDWIAAFSGEEDPIPAGENPFDLVEAMVRRGTLNQRQRDILLLHFKGDRTLQEVGRVFGLSKESIRQQEQVIFKRMRETYTGKKRHEHGQV